MFSKASSSQVLFGQYFASVKIPVGNFHFTAYQGFRSWLC